MLALLMQVIYGVHRWDRLRWHDIYLYVQRFVKSGASVEGILRLSQQFEMLLCWYY
jgi:hypothetical protein